MDTLILLGAAGGLLPLRPVRDCDQGVTGPPGDSLERSLVLEALITCLVCHKERLPGPRLR
jgi:hypothetical protein